jgi:hypothetical protein
MISGANLLAATHVLMVASGGPVYLVIRHGRIGTSSPGSRLLEREDAAREANVKVLALGVLLVSMGCATPYAYSFHLENQDARASAKPNQPDVLDDADVRAEIVVDPTGARAIILDLTNKTDQVLQVEWGQITMIRSDGSSTSPRPHVDLGWILPGATVNARLVPFALPPSGDQAASYQGSRFELVVPMIVRREPKLYRYSFAVSVRRI